MFKPILNPTWKSIFSGVALPNGIVLQKKIHFIIIILTNNINNYPGSVSIAAACDANAKKANIWNKIVLLKLMQIKNKRMLKLK